MTRKVDAAGFTILKTLRTVEEAIAWIERHVNECQRHVVIDKDLFSGMYNVLDMGD